jgi:hypothetical protein
VPFGNGTVGDWTCHVVDPVFWALDLGAPTSVQSEVPLASLASAQKKSARLAASAF